MRNYLKSLHIAIANMIDLGIHVRTEIKKEITKQLRIQEIKINARQLKEKGVIQELYNGREIIISLTTYSRRIYQVYMVVESLLEQTLKPNRIILWLDENEFTHDSLPLNLLMLEKRGVQIEFCENVRSYKKLIPTLRKYPEAIVITADDDILYAEDFVERLYNAYKRNPQKIYFYRGHRMKVKEGKLQAYNTWDLEVKLKETSVRNFPTSGGGILFSTNLLDPEVMNVEAFTQLAPTADDVWFKAMSMKKGTQCEQIQLECPYGDKYIFLDAMDDMGLAKINQLQNQNDVQISAVFTKYDLYKKL